MALIFRPTGRAAALLTVEDARRLARETKDKQVKNSVYKGFILRAYGLGDNVIVQVIDTPSVLMYAQYNDYGPGSWPLVTAQYTPGRDIAMRAPTGKPTPEYELVTATADTFVGFGTHAFFSTTTAFAGFFNASIVPSSSGEYVVGASVAIDTLSNTEPGSKYQTVVLVNAGGTKTAKAGIETTIRTSVYTQQRYTWDDTFLATLLGQPDLRMGLRLGGGWSWFPYIDAQTAIRPAVYPPEDAGSKVSEQFCIAQTVFIHPPYNVDPTLNGEKSLVTGIFAAGITPWPDLLPPAGYLITFAYRRLILLSGLGIPDLVPQISTGRTHLVAPDPLLMLRNLINCVGTVIGRVNNQRVLFACTVDQDETEITGTDGSGDPIYTTWKKTAHYVLLVEAVTGVATVVHSTVFADEAESAAHFGIPVRPDIPTIHTFNQCNVRARVDQDYEDISYLAFNRLLIKTVSAVWPRIEHTDTQFVLLRDDGVEIPTGLNAAGYTAIMPKYNGLFSVDGNVANFGFTSDATGAVAFDIGNNQIGVLATADQTSLVSQRIQLVVIDALSGDFIEARGVIGTYEPSLTLNAAGSCAQRDLDEPPAAPQPGVFLVGIARYISNDRDQYVSNDGGWTWVKYLEGAAGTPYYLGNKLHRAVLSHTI